MVSRLSRYENSIVWPVRLKAEDHYANDYPDELDSDDEWNVNLRSDTEDGMDDHYHLSDGERD